MTTSSFKLSRAVLLFGLVALALLFPRSVLAGQSTGPDMTLESRHIVSPAEVRASALAAPAVRKAQVDQLARIIDSDVARRQLSRWGISAEQAKAAVAGLDDTELAYLAARAEGVMAELEGSGKNMWLVAGIAAGVVLAICIYLLATTEY
jgi:hypothetical protein